MLDMLVETKFYKEYSGTTMKIDDEEFIVIKDEDIIAVSK